MLIAFHLFSLIVGLTQPASGQAFSRRGELRGKRELPGREKVESSKQSFFVIEPFPFTFAIKGSSKEETCEEYR